jgi:hypothetical protein
VTNSRAYYDAELIIELKRLLVDAVEQPKY